MAQISRPFQIGLVAVALLAAVWLFALRGHSSSSSEATSAPASHPATAAKPASTGPTAPGVSGLTKDVEKARGAVAASEHNASKLEQKSAQVSGEAAKPAATHTAAKSHTTTAPGAVSAPAAKSKAASGSSQRVLPGIPERQHAVEAAVASGGVALILFWNPHATDDRAVHTAMRTVVKSQHGVIAFQAKGQEVATFGSVTRGVQVFGTPTMLVVGKRLQAHVLSGLTDPFAIEQAVAEVRAQ